MSHAAFGSAPESVYRRTARRLGGSERVASRGPPSSRLSQAAGPATRCPAAPICAISCPGPGGVRPIGSCDSPGPSPPGRRCISATC